MISYCSLLIQDVTTVETYNIYNPFNTNEKGKKNLVGGILYI